MEQMIIAMIYLYPGALVDILRRVFFKRTYRDEETSDSTRAAKHFVFSTMISVASLLIYGRLAGKSVANPADLLNTFSATMEIPRFFLISLGMTVLFSCALEGLEEGYAKLRSLRLKETEQMKIDRSADTWHTLVYSKDFKYARSALVLRIKSGAGEQVGICYSLPDNLEDGIALMWSPETCAAFKHDEETAADDEKLLFGPVVIYCDPKTGINVEFFEAQKLFDQIQAGQSLAG